MCVIAEALASERRVFMFVNCYDSYGTCLFSVPAKEGVKPEELADHIYAHNEEVDTYRVTDQPEGAVVKY